MQSLRVTRIPFSILKFLLISICIVSCARPVFKSKWTQETAPEVYNARFETTKGNFDIEITRRLSPKAADRFYQLIVHGYYEKDALFYRVVPKFVAQFGTSDAAKQKKWGKIKIDDEEVLAGNLKGTISFARSGKQTRTTTLFINLKDNPRLDTLAYNGVKGFPAFGKVTNGMQVVESLYGGYADSTMKKYDMLFRDRNGFNQMFPLLDRIKRAYIIQQP